MVLRFEVNQAEAFRQGVDVPKSTNHIVVDPSTVSQDERNLIADRLEGIDLVRLTVNSERKIVHVEYSDMERCRIVAKLPTYEALIQAIRENQSELDAELKRRGN